MQSHLHYTGVRQSLSGIGVSLKRIVGGNYSVNRMGGNAADAVETDCLHEAYVSGLKLSKGRA